MTESASAPFPSATLLQRWLLAYLLLYAAPFPLNFVPGLDMVLAIPGAAWQAVVTWVGAVVFDVEAIPRRTGSGDTMFDYVQLFCLAAVAVPAALLWPRSLRAGVDWDRLLDRARAYLRLYLGCYLLVYGLCKAIPTQFPPPGPDRLVVPYGDSSPMGLLWTFMGASPAYVMCTGIVETIAGALLLWRRTATLGALLALMAMSQVLLLNLCYDVAVKQFSAHLVLVGLYVLAPDVSRLLDVLWFHRPVQPRPLAPYPIARRGLRRALTATRVGLIACVVVVTAAQGLWVLSMNREPGPLHGVYRVVSFQRGSEVVVPDEARWARVGINTMGIGAIQLADGSGQRYRLNIDAEQKTLSWQRIGADESQVLTYSEPTAGELVIEGAFDGAATVARLRRIDEPFLLTSRGFRWIQERPFNR
ncbi:hypothetical protein [Nannocystis punicea]|uniref:DoxX family protein n=1 Tax=Nannocystis punicea TaxID=2995304 RepID=A0ABY7HDU6_9BACT|nr:hypothetical protein [Nannocystis poenicansa]WAS97366.1 hypothetical protein O0S08_14560 [Nannocystis poenicansa]